MVLGLIFSREKSPKRFDHACTLAFGIGIIRDTDRCLCSTGVHVAEFGQKQRLLIRGEPAGTREKFRP